MSRMSMFIECDNKECDFSAKVSGLPYEMSKLIRYGQYCPQCNEPMELLPSDANVEDFSPKYELSYSQYFAAVNHLGLPQEVVSCKEVVSSMLLAHKVVEVDIEEKFDRCVVNSLTLDDGVTFHFAASGMGAVIFKATRRNTNASKRTNDSGEPEGEQPSKLSSSCDIYTYESGQVHRR